MGYTTDAFMALGIVVSKTKNEVLALSEAFAEQSRKAREAAEPVLSATGSSRGSSSSSGGGRFSNAGTDDGFARSGSSGSGGLGRTRGGSSSGSSGGNFADPYSGGGGRGTDYRDAAYGQSRTNQSRTITVRDDATVSEIKGLRSDLKKSGGII